MIFLVKRAIIRWQKLRENNIKHRKITCQFVLDIGPNTTQCNVECNSTMKG